MYSHSIVGFLSSFWWHITARFGFYHPVVLIVSTLGIILALGSLSSLWLWTSKDNPELLRSKIALSGWTMSVVAICSALLRICLVTQVAICCKMVATLAFEKKCVLLQDAAAMSIYRYSATDPYAMIFPVVRGTRVGKKPLGIILLALLSFVTVLSQFISTILFSDIGFGNIPRRSENVSLAYMTVNGIPAGNYPRFRQKPSVFPRFAERTSKHFLISHNATGPGISDTGPTMRALLPLPSLQRSSLVYYHGMAALINSQVLCTAPSVDQLRYDTNNDSMLATLSVPMLQEALDSGQFEDQGSFLKTGIKLPTFTVNCRLLSPNITRDFLCPALPHPDYYGNNSNSFILDYEAVAGYPMKWWLAVRYTNSNPDPSNNTGIDLTTLSYLYKKDGYTFNGTEWITKSVEGTNNMTADMTLCVATFGIDYGQVQVQADSNATELWYPVAIAPGTEYPHAHFNITLIRDQLMVGGRNHQKLGIFNLTDYKVTERASELYDPLFEQHYLAKFSSIVMPSLHPVYNNMFRETIAETKTAALALQSIFTLLVANGYYEQMEIYDKFDVSIVQYVKSVVVPTTNRGLFLVCGIIGLHFISVAVVSWLYFKSDAPKFLDQAWQTVSQLQCGEAKEFLHYASDLGDRAVGRLPSAAAKWTTLVGISKQDRDQGKIAIKCEDLSYIPLESFHGRE